MNKAQMIVASAAVLAAALGCSTKSEASTLLAFTFHGDEFDGTTFTLSSDPTPVGGDGTSYFTANTSLGQVSFYLATLAGGLDFGGISFAGDVLFSNTLAAPHFAAGTYDISHDYFSGQDYHETLTVAATPIPATLPLLATALGGLGFAGWQRRKSAQPAV